MAFSTYAIKGSLSALEVQANHFLPLSDFSKDLFPQLLAAKHNDENFLALYDKLTSCLGLGCVKVARVVEEYFPEYQEQWQPWRAREKSAVPKPVSPYSQLPNWLLAKPQPLSASTTILAGPQRVDGHWWNRQQPREYYWLQDERGRLVWAYRETMSGKWYLHGIYG